VPIVIFERQGSGDYERGPNGMTGQVLLAVVGATTQDEALDAAEADPAAPVAVAGFTRGKGHVQHQGGELYFVDFDYDRGIPGEGGAGLGMPVDGGRPTSGADGSTQLSRDVSVTAGGATRRIFYSRQTRHSEGRAGGAAPNFGKLIGVRLDGGEIEGCEVLAPACDFTITKRAVIVTLSWFRFMMDCVACFNESSFLGTEPGETLFKGADLSYKDGDQIPWTVAGKFGYNRNRTIDDSPDELTLGPADDPTKQITLPDVRGWDYVWVIYQKEDEVIGSQDLVIQRPLYAYVEEVYEPKDLNQLGFN
jgi:hypothetical protein